MDTGFRKASDFEICVPIVVIGGGACGLSASLAVRDAGVEVLVIERDPKLWGTTSMSTGLIPASGTVDQQHAGISDNPELFYDDIVGKTKGNTDYDIALHLAQESSDTLDWHRNSYGVGLSLITDFLYPGHSVMRMPASHKINYQPSA